MTQMAERLLARVMRLDPADRVELFDRMAERVDPGGPSDDPAYAAEWEANGRDQIDAVEPGELVPFPAADVVAPLRSCQGDGDR